MMKEFNSYNLAKPYSMYRSVYRTICAHIDALNHVIETGNYSASALDHFALKLYNYTFVFEGYTDCLYDLKIINDVEYNAFYEFCRAIRWECNPNI